MLEQDKCGVDCDCQDGCQLKDAIHINTGEMEQYIADRTGIDSDTIEIVLKYEEAFLIEKGVIPAEDE